MQCIFFANYSITVPENARSSNGQISTAKEIAQNIAGPYSKDMPIVTKIGATLERAQRRTNKLDQRHLRSPAIPTTRISFLQDEVDRLMP